MVPEKLTRRKVRKRKEEENGTDPIMARRTQTHWSTNLFRIWMIAEYSIHLWYHSLQMYSSTLTLTLTRICTKSSTILFWKSLSLFFINQALDSLSGLFILHPISVVFCLFHCGQCGPGRVHIKIVITKFRILLSTPFIALPKSRGFGGNWPV